MFGYIIYAQKDIQKNHIFYEMLKKEFLRHDIRLELIIYEQFQTERLAKNPLPRFVINRSRFYDIARLFEQLGIRVFNTSAVTKITNDKLETFHYFKKTVPMMESVGRNDYQSGFFPYPIILKSCDGHSGTEVFMANSPVEEKAAVEALKGKNYLVQKCCSDLGRDARVYIIGNEIAAAVLRSSKTRFQSNYSLGGAVQPYQLNDYEKTLVQSVLDRLYLDYAGIDFIFHHGKAVLNEIEDAVGARMLYQTSDIDIAKRYVDYIVNILSC